MVVEVSTSVGAGVSIVVGCSLVNVVTGGSVWAGVGVVWAEPVSTVVDARLGGGAVSPGVLASLPLHATRALRSNTQSRWAEVLT
jgi:hypothetical protein